MHLPHNSGAPRSLLAFPMLLAIATSNCGCIYMMTRSVAQWPEHQACRFERATQAHVLPDGRLLVTGEMTTAPCRGSADHISYGEPDSTTSFAVQAPTQDKTEANILTDRAEPTGQEPPSPSPPLSLFPHEPQDFLDQVAFAYPVPASLARRPILALRYDFGERHAYWRVLYRPGEEAGRLERPPFYVRFDRNLPAIELPPTVLKRLGAVRRWRRGDHLWSMPRQVGKLAPDATLVIDEDEFGQRLDEEWRKEGVADYCHAACAYWTRHQKIGSITYTGSLYVVKAGEVRQVVVPDQVRRHTWRTCGKYVVLPFAVIGDTILLPVEPLYYGYQQLRWFRSARSE